MKPANQENEQMKIFNFSNGVKGEELANVKVANSLGGWLTEKNGAAYRVELANPKNAPSAAGGDAGVDWKWHSRATNYVDKQDAEITPEMFDTDAICFCMGEVYTAWNAGHPEAESEWQWAVIGTAEWNREACKSGILKFTKL